MSRPWPSRRVKKTVLIVGEGQQTEPNYFDGLKREEAVSTRFSVTVKKGHGVSAEQVVEETVAHMRRAENRAEEYDEVWCALDVEGLQKRDLLDKAVATAGQNKKIRLCLSNPCFEIWLLSHFVRESKRYDSCQKVIERLNKHWQDLCEQDYQKNDRHIYRRIRDYTQTAIANAEWVRETDHGDKKNTADANSSTEVYQLVAYLIGQSE